MSRFALLTVTLLAVLLAAGCVTQEITPEPLTQTRLIVTRAADSAHLSWASERGFVYTVLYAERSNPRAKWKPLPECRDLVGTGATLQFVDKVAPGAERRYIIRTVPLKAQ